MASPRSWIQRFLHVEAAGGILLLAATVAALAWSNSPWSASYHGLFGDEVTHWINDGLMALFFFVIGLEIKQELAGGQLGTARDAVVPVAGAVGGMVVPALLYAAVNAGGAGAAGWGIPMATDVAFAVGVLSLLGARVPGELKVVLLGLAIVDDIGAIAVIAVFYSDGIDGRWLAAAVAGLVVVGMARVAGVRALPVYVAIAAAVWYATLESGVHATIAGVALGLLAPARGERTERLQERLHPWTSYAVVPLFALANAGVTVSGGALGDAAASPVTVGIVLGLVAGKLVGVAGATLLVVRLGMGRLPAEVTGRHVLGMAGLAGIGFTVSIFVAGLAFDDAALAEQAKLGVLAASALATLLGVSILARSGSRQGTTELA